MSTLAGRASAPIPEAQAARPAPLSRILVASDGSEASEACLRVLSLLPLEAGTVLRVLAVASEVPANAAVPLRDAAERWARRATSRATRALRRPGSRVEQRQRQGFPAREILSSASEMKPDLIVVGSHGRHGLKAFFIGSVARSVALHAPCSVLVARPPRNGLRRVILGVDDSEQAARAAQVVAALPLPRDTELVVAHVVAPYQPFPGIAPDDLAAFHREVEQERRRQRSRALRIIERAVVPLNETGRDPRVMALEGSPADELLKLAGDVGADLVVVGARSASLIRGLLMGSVAERVLEYASCSVLIAR